MRKISKTLSTKSNSPKISVPEKSGKKMDYAELKYEDNGEKYQTRLILLAS
ncbi:hypothetical protein GMLC_21750 [Geomonas limicola]|uniref:Uncharacterized protein n=1 Tax=Geomonas limicola TaxID=2740186 RepID=A0A6V8N7P5_9BACT|nr:hypothetical protein GMLC_21750 [Geomonas limicola]